jgi:glycine/serine hydroxymethyltransferase
MEGDWDVSVASTVCSLDTHKTFALLPTQNQSKPFALLPHPKPINQTQIIQQGLQGGPHNHTISALAVALKMANTAEFRAYQKQARA